jgi:hypothetical protein
LEIKDHESLDVRLVSGREGEWSHTVDHIIRRFNCRGEVIMDSGILIKLNLPNRSLFPSAIKIIWNK